MIRFSPSTKAFYPLEFNYGSNLPTDVVELSMQDYETAMARPLGYSFDFVDGAIVVIAPPPQTLEQIKAEKLAELNASFSQAIGTIKAGYPPEEIESWAKQESEARALVAGTAKNPPLLTAMALARGIDVMNLAARVIANADAWIALSGTLIGKRQAYEDQVVAAFDADAVAGVMWTD